MFNSLRSKSSNSNLFANDAASKPSGTEKKGLVEDASRESQNGKEPNKENSKEIKDAAKLEEKKRNRKTMQPIPIQYTNVIQLSGPTLVQAPTGTMKQKKGTIGSSEGKAIAKLVKASANQPPSSPSSSAKDHGVLIPYENWVKKHFSEIKKDPLSNLILFPKDDFTRTTIKKFQRTDATIKAKNKDNFALLDPHVKEVLNFFVNDWIIWEKKYNHFEKKEKKSIYSHTPLEFDDDWASGSSLDLLSRVKRYREWVAREKQYGINTLHHEYMERFASESSELNAQTRKQDRLDIFQSFFPEYEWESTEQWAKEPVPFATDSKPGIKFTIEMKNLGFAVGEVEPFFASIAVYNIRTKKRLSENAFFESNSEGVLSLIYKKEKLAEVDPEVKTKHFLFNVSKPNEDVCLILKIDKVLQGDIEESQEPYMKIDMHENEKYKKKAFETVGAFCKRLGEYRQPFGWSCLPLFTKTGTLALRGNCTFNDIYRFTAKELDDDSILDLVLESRDHPKNFEKKVKSIPGFCNFVINEANLAEFNKMNIYQILDPSLEPVRAFDPVTHSEISPQVPRESLILLREVQDFPEIPYLHMSLSYINNLYVYPLSVNLSGRSNAKNIGVRVQLRENDTFESREGLKAIYGGLLSPKLNQSATTLVAYHNKQPQFRDEIKVALPSRLTQRHHLFFTFFHVATKEKKKGPVDEVETIIGYSALPIYPNGKVLDEDQHLPVFVNQDLKKWKNYLQDKDVQYIEGQKPLFHVRVKLVSSIYTQDKHLNAFFHSYHLQDQNRVSEAVKALKEVPTHTTVQFMPVIFNQLFHIMSFFAKTPIATESLNALLHILKQINNETKNDQRNIFVAQYLDHIYDTVKVPDGEYIYESICKNYLISLLQNKISTEDVSIFWFILDIVSKSMALKVLQTGELASDEPDRSKWFLGSYILLLKKLISFITTHFKKKCQGEFAPGEFKILVDANKSLALFVRNLFSYLDRGHVLDMVDTYVKEIHPENIEDVPGTKLLFFKFDFLKIIGDYEHYMQLNFPVSPDIEIHSQLKHPLSSIIIREVFECLRHSLGGLRSKALGVLNQIVAKHDYDTRYQSVEIRSRIAYIYFELIVLIINRWNDDYFKKWRQTAEAFEKRLLYVNVLYVLRNCDPELLKKWWSNEITNRLLVFLEILGDCVSTFEYKSPESLKSATKKGIITDPSTTTSKRTRSFAMQEESTPSKGLSDSSAKYNSTKGNSVGDKTSNRMSIVPGSISANSSNLNVTTSIDKQSSENGKLKMQTPQKTRMKEGVCAYESSIVVLDITELFIDHFEEDLSVTTISNKTEERNPLMERVVSLFVLILQCIQPVKFLLHFFARSFILRFKKIMFIQNQNNTYCGDFSFELLRYCNSGNFSVRDEATCLLYLLVKYNHHFGNFRRIAIQLITSLAKLVSVGRLEAEPEMFEMSLAKLCSFALFDYSMPYNPVDIKNAIPILLDKKTNFVRQTEELTGRLSKIFRDTMHVQEIRLRADGEMIADLYFRIAKSYTNTPELRVTWLDALYKLHLSYESYTQAAVCLVHIAAIITDYLKLMDRSLPINSKYFNSICPYLYEPVEEEERGLFTENDLVNAVNAAIENFIKANFYESAITLHKFLIPIYEKNNSYGALSHVFDECGKLYTKITESGDTRMLGKYYRVGFYGIKFEDLNGKEFVYNEPKSTHLFEIKDKLKDFYGKLFGDSNVIVWPDSSKVDTSKLETHKCYLQITSLDPYFETMESRQTHFERNTLLNQFVFTTPFTLGGKSNQGSIDEQYIRKTIINVDITFPYLLKRVPVTNKREIVTTPVENAIELVERINVKISAELKISPINTKSLQGLLQGSILASVNEGPIEICKKFLKQSETLLSDVHKQRLKQVLQEFLNLCRNAVSLNKNLITSDQVEFQSALEQGLSKLKRRMNRYISGKPHKSKTGDESDKSDGEETKKRKKITKSASRDRANEPSTVEKNNNFIRRSETVDKKVKASTLRPKKETSKFGSTREKDPKSLSKDSLPDTFKRDTERLEATPAPVPVASIASKEDDNESLPEEKLEEPVSMPVFPTSPPQQSPLKKSSTSDSTSSQSKVEIESNIPVPPTRPEVVDWLDIDMNTKMEELKREEEELKRAEEELARQAAMLNQKSLENTRNTSLEYSVDEPPQYTEDWTRRYSLASNASLPDYGEVAEDSN